MTRKIAYIITGLGVGGAEHALLRITTGLIRFGFEQKVFCLTQEGPLADQFREFGIEVEAIGLNPRLPQLSRLNHLTKRLREFNPNLVQTWMYHADLLGSWAARRAGIVPICWGIRNSTLTGAASKRSTQLIRSLCARLSSSWPARIISCSQDAAQIHIGLGYDRTKMLVIPNGFELAAFQPDANLRQDFRTNLGVSNDTILIGHAARFHPQKGHHIFLEAAQNLLRERDDVAIVLCGKDVISSESLFEQAIQNFPEKKLFVLGQRADMSAFYNSLDLFVMSSIAGEAFPNVVAEAMACGVPAVVTDVGDAASIVGSTGYVVPDFAAGSLVKQMRCALDGLGAPRSAECRERIVKFFDLEDIVKRYADLYEGLMSKVCVD